MTWRVTPAERRALAALARDVPRAWPDLAPHMRRPTLRGLCGTKDGRPPLVDDMTLKAAWGINQAGWTFYRLTELGAVMKRAAAR